jgi:photosystem II stability/assembly factor-like uncharacterized protein
MREETMQIKKGSQIASSLILILILFTVGCVPSAPTTIAISSPQTATGQVIPLNTAPPANTTTPTVQPSETLTMSSGASDPLNFVQMVNETQGWAIADQSVLRTENGGKSWSDVTPTRIETVMSTIPTPAPQGLNSIELKGAFLDAQTAWIAAPGLDRITFFHTVDGGRTWQASELVVSTPQQVYPIEIVSFTFLNVQTGWLFRSTSGGLGHGFVELYQTQNSGASWSLVAEGNENASGETGSITTLGQKTGVSFRDTANGWLTGSSAYNAIYVYRTKDGGLTWNFQELPIPDGYTAEGGSARSYPATFFDDKKGLMPIYLGKTTPSFNLFFYITTDGGDSWFSTTPLSSPTPTNGFVWNWSDSLHGFAAEDGTGILYTTSDGGKSWSKSTLAGLKFSQLDFISQLIGWAISDGYLVKTVDGGKNWRTIYP